MSTPSPAPVHWREAALCVPALAVLFGLGVWTGHPVPGAIAAGAAFSVGFGAARELHGRRWGAMVAATVGMAIATFVGSLAGRELALLLVVAALAAGGCAMLALRDEDLWWVVLQSIIALLVAGSYAGSVHAAGIRALDVLVGGATQIAAVVLLAHLVPRLGAWEFARKALPVPTASALLAHALRAVVAVAGALGVAEAFHLSNAYWAPMTVLLILKPGLHDTQSRGLERLAGTVVGCAVATLFAIAVHEARSAMAIGFLVMAGVAYALQKARYALFSGALTASIVLLISLGRFSVLVNAEHRILATLLGGVIALLIARIGPADLKQPATVDRVGTVG